MTFQNNSEMNAARMVEDILGCKWSLTILQRIREGVTRPGALNRSVEGLSSKVMYDRLDKMMRYGIVEKHVHATMPPEVEYHLTDFGGRFAGVLDSIEALERELSGQDAGERK